MADPRVGTGRGRWGARLLRAYPGWWRSRYEAEVLAILDTRPPGVRDAVDLLRGACDAHLHPAAPSRLSAQAALLAGAAWTVVTLAVVLEPVPPDWPGYLAWILPVALAGVVAGLVAGLGLALRLGDAPGRLGWGAIALLLAGHLAWAAALTVAIVGGPYGALTGAASTAAAVGTVVLGGALVRAQRPAVGPWLMIIATALVLPPPAAWAAMAAGWTTLGGWLVAERGRAIAAPPRPDGES